jgi:hypothetical protein
MMRPHRREAAAPLFSRAVLLEILALFDVCAPGPESLATRLIDRFEVRP